MNSDIIRLRYKITSIIQDDQNYTNAEELNKLHTVDVAALGLTVLASIVITTAAPIVIAGIVINAAAYIAKDYIVSEYN